MLIAPAFLFMAEFCASYLLHLEGIVIKESLCDRKAVCTVTPEGWVPNA